jgi:adenylate kinase
MSNQSKFPGRIRVVIVGRHGTIKQHAIACQLMARGAIIQRQVNTETDILIALSVTQGTDAARAAELRKRGHPIVFPREVDLSAMLNDPAGFFDSLPSEIKSRRLAAVEASAETIHTARNSEREAHCAHQQLGLFQAVPRRSPLFLMNL